MSRRDELRFRLVSERGSVAIVGAYGARLNELWVPDRHGRLADVTLGFDRDEDYRTHREMYIGATIGRIAGRIRSARFSLDGSVYELSANEPPNHRHGGAERSFDRVVWDSRAQRVRGHPSVRFTYRSPHLEEGYPGSVSASVTYTLAGLALWITYEARTDRPTPVSLTSHAYWNLAGAGSATVLDHDLVLAANRYTPADRELVPTGIVAPVAGTPLDFTTARTIGDRIARLGAEPAEGYDHNYLIDGNRGTLRRAALLRHQASGRSMELSTTEAALQVYSSNRMEAVTGKAGQDYRPRSAICLEPQATPNAVNRPDAPSILVGPRQTYRHTSVYRFAVSRDAAP